MKRIITYVTKDHDSHLRDELYRCSLLWYNPDCLVIGWADRFKICKIIRRNNFSNLGLPQPNSISSLAANVLSSGASLGAHDKRDLGTHVEISKCLMNQ